MTTQGFPIPQEAVEAGLLQAVNQTMNNWMEIQANLGQEDFSTHRDIYVFMGQYLGQHGALPTTSLLATRFNFQPPIGEFSYWLQEMRRYSMARRVLEVLQEGYATIQEPERALESVLHKLSRLRSRTSNHVQATDAAALERLDMFDARTEYIHYGHNLLGLPTGFQIINDTNIGYAPGDMIGGMARIGVGKSWWMVNEGAIAWMAGYRVLCISPEMPANRLALRVDVVVGDKMNMTMDYNKLMNGDPDVRPMYEQITRVLSESERWWTYDSFEGKRIGVQELDTLCSIHKPDILLIDGISLLRSETRGGAPMWQIMHELCYNVKNDIATRHEIPVLVTHQASNTERGRRVRDDVQSRSDTFVMPSLNDAAYGDAFVQACSEVITFCPEPTSQNINWFALKKTRERGWRNPLPARMAIAIDFSRGKMVDLSRLGYDPEAVGQESRRVLGL